MEFTITQAHNVLQRLGYKGSTRTIARTIEHYNEKMNLGRRAGTKARRNPWLVTLPELRFMFEDKWGFIFSDERWQEAIDTVMGEEDAQDDAASP